MKFYGSLILFLTFEEMKDEGIMGFCIFFLVTIGKDGMD